MLPSPCVSMPMSGREPYSPACLLLSCTPPMHTVPQCYHDTAWPGCSRKLGPQQQRWFCVCHVGVCILGRFWYQLPSLCPMIVWFFYFICSLYVGRLYSVETVRLHLYFFIMYCFGSLLAGSRAEEGKKFTCFCQAMSLLES